MIYSLQGILNILIYQINSHIFGETNLLMIALLEKIENNKLFKFVKDNFSLIIFIPSLLGGLKQLTFLLTYSPSLIQYFSFSQIAIDGLEIIIQCIIVLLIVSFIYALTVGKVNRILLYSIISVILLVLYIWYSIYTDNFYKIVPYDLTTLDTYLSKFFSLFFLSIALGIFLASRGIKAENEKRFSIFKKIYLTISIVFLFYFIISYKPFQYNVENVSNVTDKVKKENSKDAELIYYNDSYLIFILNPKEDFNHRKFYVQKFETLFEDTNDKIEKK